MAIIEIELGRRILDAGTKLLSPPSSIVQLLISLERVETLLALVDQSPSKSMKEALVPSTKALVNVELLRHSDADVKVALAACISEITRITAPKAPYEDDQMKEVFQLIVSSFEKLDDRSNHSYNKRVSILGTVAKLRSCLLMLDLECDALIVEMFRQFFKTIRDDHPNSVFSSMEIIMTVLVQESDDISVDLLSLMLNVLKKVNKDVLPIACQLGEKVFIKCAGKLRPYLLPAVNSRGASLNDYIKVVADVFQAGDDAVQTTEGDALNINSAVDTNLINPSSEKIVEAPKTKVHDLELVGATVKIWWPDDKKYYQGVIASFDAINKKHTIFYSDGDVEIMNLKEEKWLLVDSKGHMDDGESPDELDLADATPEGKKAKISASPGSKQGKIGSVAKKSGASSSKSKATPKSGSKQMNDSKTTGISKEEATKKVGKPNADKIGKSKTSKSSNRLSDDDNKDTPIGSIKSKHGTTKGASKSKGKSPKSNVKSTSSGIGKVKASNFTEDEESEDDSLEPERTPEKSKEKSQSTSKSKSSTKRKRGQAIPDVFVSFLGKLYFGEAR